MTETFNGIEVGKTYRGRVVNYWDDKGFGFIRPEGAGETDHFDLFVYHKAIVEWNRAKWKRRALDQNEIVEFKAERGEGKNLRASDVRVCA